VKRQVSPVVTALILIAVLGGVFLAYHRGLLGQKKAQGKMMGGGGMKAAPPPPTGLENVTVSTFCGWERPGLTDGQGTTARFNGPAAVAAAPDGALYVADSRNHRLRRVTPDGTVTTVAGSGPVDCMPAGFADGPGDQARLFNPSGVAVARDGAVYFADTGNHRIRCLKDGTVTTVAGGPTERDALGFETGGFRDGPGPQAQFRLPGALCLTPTGDLLVADLGNSAVRRIAKDGKVTTVVRGGALKQPTGLMALAGGLVLVADSEASRLLDLHGAAASPHPGASEGVPVRRPCGVCEMPGIGVLVADAEWNAVMGIYPGQGSVLVAGILPPQPTPGYRDGKGSDARFLTPCALAVVGQTAYVVDFGNNCLRALTGPGLLGVVPEPEFPGHGKGPGGRAPR
jgi:NHL repeat